ncbi:fructose-bisphosphate aldolase, class II [Anaerovirgula multivorans]|uniref:Fructose-bisphosphate aldolase, class II n=1 Tax=Anaerovirgula multivorans TaxID=312168 RepID=A0A239D0F0_9FIRM|nr:class II fructose-bisphosphate aldolase [Anaerovirgula multivorans]SNS25592.1 fructose-bisphosphate aldolase, class II [Anaerovirgula multivorans]
MRLLLTMKELLDDANRNNYAVVAPNAWNEDTIRTAIEAAEQENAPLIIALYPVMANIEEFASIACKFASVSKVPVAVHLDHGSRFDEAIRAIRSGYTSIMVDRSQLPFDDNVREVKEIVKIAHAVGVAVEAELGHVGQGKDYAKTRDCGLTRVDEAIRFVQETQVDCLAVAVGTSHGIYCGEPKIDFELLKALKEKINVPLVLHGSSGTGDENIAKCVTEGINKINLFTDLDLSASEKLIEYMTDKRSIRIVEICNVLYNGYKEKLVHNIRLVRSNNRV